MDCSNYYIVEKPATGEIVEKKSRFIGHIFPIKSEQESMEIIDRIKKEYWDARHNCFAFMVGENNETQRFSDDGEPQGTAGKPILEVLSANNIHNTLIVVTRYFGGTLLGTGGLVRAYSAASKEALKNAVIKKVTPGISLDITVDYNSIGKIKYIISQAGVTVNDEIYGADVKLSVSMKEQDKDGLISKITDATGGQAVVDNQQAIEYLEDIENLF